jgi:uncharacterized protein with HEPN domain
MEIIGEAMSKLLKINPIISISYSRIIVDLRNKVIHADDSVNDILIWKIVNIDIPQLLIEANTLINEN